METELGAGAATVVCPDGKCHGALALGKVLGTQVHVGPWCPIAPGAAVGLTLPPAWDSDLDPGAHQGRMPLSPEL